MTVVAEIARLIRSKNAGPFQLTFDIMFDRPEDFERAKASLQFRDDVIGRLYNQPSEKVQIYFCDRALAIKISIPRPCAQGDLFDSDGHGGQQYAPLMSLELGPA